MFIENRRNSTLKIFDSLNYLRHEILHYTQSASKVSPWNMFQNKCATQKSMFLHYMCVVLYLWWFTKILSQIPRLFVTVKLQSVISDSGIIGYGVTQGKILGPIIFPIYIIISTTLKLMGQLFPILRIASV